MQKPYIQRDSAQSLEEKFTEALQNKNSYFVFHITGVGWCG